MDLLAAAVGIECKARVPTLVHDKQFDCTYDDESADKTHSKAKLVS